MSMDTGHRDWPTISDQNLDSRYEKCRNITEEIYKRINITFQIKKLEAGQSELSDNSELIDSNELSNETDLFACDKSDITSSTEAEKPPTDCGKFININNNEEKNKPPPVYKRPKKRFRKRVKKRQVRACSDSEGSSDEAPLSRMTEPPDLDTVGQSTVLKPKPDKRPNKKDTTKKSPASKSTHKKLPAEAIDKKTIEFCGKTLSVRIDKLPIETVASYEDFPVKNYRSFMKDNKLTIKSDSSSVRIDKAADLAAKDGVPIVNDDRVLKTDKLSMKTDKLSMKTDKLSMKTDKLSTETDKLSMKEENDKGAQWKCSLCSLSFRGERGLRRHMSMSHIMPENYN